MGFITKIRQGDEPARRRWLIILSGLTMIAVIGLWLGYLDLTVESVDSGETISQAANPAEPGFDQIFGAGLGAIVSGLEKSFGKAGDILKDQLGGANQIVVSRREINFVFEGLEKIPRTPLP